MVSGWFGGLDALNPAYSKVITASSELAGKALQACSAVWCNNTVIENETAIAMMFFKVVYPNLTNSLLPYKYSYVKL